MGATIGACLASPAGALASQYFPFFGGWLVQIAEPFSKARLQVLPAHCVSFGVVGFFLGGLIGAVIKYICGDENTVSAQDTQRVRRQRGPSSRPFFLLTLVLAVCVGVVAVALASVVFPSLKSGTALDNLTARDAWQRKVVDHLKKTERGVRVKEISNPEPIEGARVVKDLGAGVGPVLFSVDEVYPIGKKLWEYRAVRVAYETDEGFGEFDYHETVFLVHEENGVVGSVKPHQFRIGKPGEEKASGKQAMRKGETLLQGIFRDDERYRPPPSPAKGRGIFDSDR